MMIMLGLVMIGAFYFDLRFRKIPNLLTLPAIVSGIMGNTLRAGWDGCGFALAGLLAGAAATTLLYIVRAVGAGDVKLFGAIGAWSGTAFAIECLLNAILIAAAIGAVWMLVRKRLFSQWQLFGFAFRMMILEKDARFVMSAVKGAHMKIPFMIAVMPSFLIMGIGMGMG